MERLLAKYLKQYQKDYGDLLISHRETQHELESLRNECNVLRARLGPADDEIARLTEQFEAQIMDFTAQIKIFKKQNLELSGEVVRLESNKTTIEAECMELKQEFAKKEEFWKKEKKIMVEKLKEGKEKSETRYNQLNTRYNAVMASATDRYKMLEDRVTKLEKDVSMLKQDSPAAGFLDMPPVSENILASAVPCVRESALVSSFLVDLDSSDDDKEPPLPAVVKRKISTTGTSDKGEGDGGSSGKHRKYTEQSGVILQPCEQKVGVA